MELRRRVAKSLGYRTQEKSSGKNSKNGFTCKSWLMATLVPQRSMLVRGMIMKHLYDNEARLAGKIGL